MASNLVRPPGTSRSLACPQGAFTSRTSSAPFSVRRPCTCMLTPGHREIKVVDKAMAGAAAAVLSLGAFACGPALADLNKFEAAAGGEFGVGTAMQYGDAELRGKDFSGQVFVSLTVMCERHWRAYKNDHQSQLCCRISGGQILPQQMPAMPTSRAPSCKAPTSSKL